MYRLLVVDDEDIERSAIKHIVHRACPAIGDVHEAASGREALVTAREKSPDLIFLDIKMPGMSGLEAGRELRWLFPELRMAFLSAYDYFDYAQEAIRIGVDDFLIKPVSPNRVVEVVDRMVGILDTRGEFRRRFADTQRRLALLRDYFRSAFVEGLLAGDLSSGNLADRLAALDIRYSGGITACAAIDYASFPLAVQTGRERDLLKQRCMEILKSRVESDFPSSCAHEGEGLVQLVVFHGSEDERVDPTLLERVLEEAAATVSTQLSLHLLFRVGEPFVTPAEARLSLAAAASSLRDEKPLGPRLTRLMEQVVRRLAEDYGKVITLEDAATQVRLSSFYFSKVFHQYTGRTFIDYLNETRIARARGLLADPSVNVKEIASKVGFSDSNYFARVFKKITGHTPTEFRDMTRM